MPNHRRQDREVDVLYRTLPMLNCQGHCADSCGPIECSVRERARIVERARQPLNCSKGRCSMLTDEGRCSVYDVRPMVCRLWGLVPSMRCPYGCKPEGGYLSEREGMRMLLEANAIGGPPERQIDMTTAMLDLLSDEDIVALVAMLPTQATLDERLPTRHRLGLRAPFEQVGYPVGEHSMAYPDRRPGK